MYIFFSKTYNCIPAFKAQSSQTQQLEKYTDYAPNESKFTAKDMEKMVKILKRERAKERLKNGVKFFFFITGGLALPVGGTYYSTKHINKQTALTENTIKHNKELTDSIKTKQLLPEIMKKIKR